MPEHGLNKDNKNQDNMGCRKVIRPQPYITTRQAPRNVGSGKNSIHEEKRYNWLSHTKYKFSKYIQIDNIIQIE